MTTIELLEDFEPVNIKRRLNITEFDNITDPDQLKGALVADPSSPYNLNPSARKNWKLKMSKDFDF